MRLLTINETGLLRELLRRAGLLDIHEGQLGGLIVEDMDDGGMGSIRLHRPDVLIECAQMDKKASELQFLDADGVLVIASLNLNIEGFPFEIDIWKVNSEPLQFIPEQGKFTDVEYTVIPDKGNGLE